MIALDRVTKWYPTRGGRRYILRDVSMTLPRDRNIAILGRNGAGKSTFMRLVGGIEYPNSGTISTDLRVSWPMGLTGGFQGSLTGRQNSAFVCRIFSTDRREIAERVAYVWDFSELGEYFDMPLKTYSSGMRSRLAFALSMAFEFEVYLIDEITSVGDQAFREKSAAALEERRGRASVILVSHSMPMLRHLCDMGILLENGEVSAFDTVDEAIARYQTLLREAPGMTGRAQAEPPAAVAG
ncbi:MAG: ABC transporter ATP-binding protein [Steroidobacteraceae bacterium]|nr:ABC transporter ATP-binding protein [Steroidobacteraceae bacterium]